MIPAAIFVGALKKCSNYKIINHSKFPERSDAGVIPVSAHKMNVKFDVV